MFLMLLACPSPLDPPPKNPTGEGIFADGCPVAGRSTARPLLGDHERMVGHDALGGPGDVLLSNSKVAYVISDPKNPKTYYHYGGMVIDAVALEGCTQAAPESFGEWGFLVGELKLADFEASHLHMIRGIEATVVSDGHLGGPAVVEISATDDRFWLVEMDLLRRLLRAGRPERLLPPWGLDITLRYTLYPDDPVLHSEVVLRSEQDMDLLVGSILFPSDHTELIAAGLDRISVGGLGLDTSVPWVGLESLDGDGGYAIGMPGANLAKTEISGVTALVDVYQALQALEVGPTQPVTVPLSLVAAPTLNQAVNALCPALKEPIPGSDCTQTPVAGRVLDPDGLPVADASVDVQVQDPDGVWHNVSRLRTDTEGSYEGDILSLGWPSRLLPNASGRWTGVPEENGDLSIGAAGSLRMDITDGDGQQIPAMITLTQGENRRLLYAIPGEDPQPLPPGTWTVSVARGFEYEPVQTEVTVPEGGEAVLTATLLHLVDTEGWMSFDGHVHDEPSADSTVLPVDRARSAAGTGLEVVIHTNHENIQDLSPAIKEAGVSAWMADVVGQEVTATSPEHTNAWPFPPDFSDPRGNSVKWYGGGLGEIFALEAERGAQVRVLNHPRGGCNFLCLTGWDRLAGNVTLTDPTLMGMDADATIWSWDFEGVEYMNGFPNVYVNPDDPGSSGLIEDWLSFQNHGHPIVALGTSDSHGFEDLGFPRTYFASSTDDPASFDQEELVASIQSGKAVVSAGAFARVSANGAGMGELASAPDGNLDLWVQVQAVPSIDVSRVEVLVNCDRVATVAATRPDEVIKFDDLIPLTLEQDAYVVVLAFGEGYLPDGLPWYDPTGTPRVTTNPIYVDVDGDGAFTAPGGKICAL